MTQPGWASRLTRAISAEILRHRKARGMSAQQLADRCAEIGLDISRSTLADLENGRRATVSVPELLVLAAALRIPPILLIAPLGRSETTEILPGRELLTWDAVLWHSGEARIAEDTSERETEWLTWQNDDGVVPLHHRHDQLVSDMSEGGIWESAVGTNDAGKIDLAATASLQRGLRRELEDDLRTVRARMLALGLTPPALPEELSYIDQRRPGGRRR